jgi:hypothetical protein
MTHPLPMRIRTDKSLIVVIGATCASLIWSLSASAGELPNYPVERWCDQVAQSAGSRSELIYGGCIGQEQTAYDRLKGTWAPTCHHKPKIGAIR